MKVLVVFACAMFAATEAVSFGLLPVYHKVCIIINEHSKNDVIALRIKQFLEYAIANAEHGLPLYNIPPLEPLILPSTGPLVGAMIEGKLNMTLTTSNVTSYGWKNIRVEDVQVTGSGKARQLRLLGRFPQLNFTEGTWFITSPVQCNGSTVAVANDGEFVTDAKVSKNGISNITTEANFREVIKDPINVFPDMPTTLRLIVQEGVEEAISVLLQNIKGLFCESEYCDLGIKY